MLRRLVISLLGLALCWANPAFAWGSRAHGAITELAMANVSPATRKAVAELLAHEQELGTPKCRIETAADASTWPDCVRLERWRWGFTSPWHQQDIPICAGFDPKIDCANGICVTAQIERTRRILADKSLPVPERLVALIFLLHLTEDIHQPLHVSDLNNDYGAGGISVMNLPFGPIVQPAKPSPIVVRPELKPISLHWVWDDTISGRVLDADHGFVRSYTAAEKADFATGTVTDWAKESWQLARDVVYPQAFGHDPCVGAAPKEVTLSDTQLAQDMPIVRERMVQAGLRLAKLLDEALAS